MSFESFNLHPAVVQGVRSCGYETPTPIQADAIPVILSGRDVLGLAQTGTGKTAAFALPILQMLTKEPAKHVRALIIAPTRELADQINQSIQDLSRHFPCKTATIYGGVGMVPQIQRLKRGVDIIVACPGRLMDHIRRRTVDLRGLEMLVLDEADHMFDMGFIPTIRDILRNIPQDRQTLMFSATMPREIRHLAEAVLRDPVPISVSNSEPTSTVSHALYPVQPQAKVALLMHLVKSIQSDSLIIFTRTKHRAKRLAEQFQKDGYNATCLQGNMSQSKRQQSIAGFRSGKYKILVATDIAARGIDVSQISHVINFDIPGTVDAYTHRIGRTGRAAKTGEAFTLVEPGDRGMVRDIERVLKQEIERRTVEGFDSHLANSHLVGHSNNLDNRRDGRGGSRGGRPGGNGGGFRSRSGRPQQQGRQRQGGNGRSFHPSQTHQ